MSTGWGKCLYGLGREETGRRSDGGPDSLVDRESLHGKTGSKSGTCSDSSPEGTGGKDGVLTGKGLTEWSPYQ